MPGEANLKINVDFDAKAANTQIRNMQSYLKTLQTSAKSLSSELQAKQKQLSDVHNLMAAGGSDSSMREWVEQEAKLIEETDQLDMQLAAIDKRTKEISQNIIDAQLNPVSYQKAADNAAQLDKNVKNAGKSSKNLKTNTDKIAKSGRNATGAFEKFGNRLKGIAAGALFFNAISTGLTSLRKAMGQLISADSGLSSSLDRIKGNLLTAFQPIWEAVLPALKTLFSWIEKITGALANFVAGAFGTTATQAAKNAKAMYSQANATSNVAKETKAASKEAKLATASFDTLNMLDSGDENAENDISVVSDKTPDFSSGINGQLDKIDTSVFEKLFEPLMKIELNPLKKSLSGLWDAIKPFSQTMFQGLTFVWTNVLMPMAQWAMESLLPHFIDLISQALLTVNDILLALQPSLSFIWDSLLKPIGEWLGGAIIEIIDRVKAAIAYLGESVQEHAGAINNVIQGIIVVLRAAFEIVKGILDAAIALIGNLLNIIIDTVMDVFEVLGGLIDFIVGIFTGDMNRAMKGLGNIFIGIANVVIDLLNALWAAIYAVIAGIVNGIGGAIGWIGELFGQDWGWTIPNDPPLIPRFPYLAQGAVIPPNKPFAAIVGDQRNGTNIEAPLATIIEAMNMALDARGTDNITLNVNGDLAGLFKYLNINIEKEKKRVSAFS